MQSAMSGNINTLDVAITHEQFSAWVDGALMKPLKIVWLKSL